MSRKIEVITLMSSDEETSVEIQVTSPKLSLKRKREHDDVQINTDVKRGLFDLGTKVSKSDEENTTINKSHSVLENGAQDNSDVNHDIFEGVPLKTSKSDEENTPMKENDVVSKGCVTNLLKTINKCNKVALSESLSINTNGILESSATSFSKEIVTLETNKQQFEKLLDFCKQKLSPQEGIQMHQTIMNKYNRASETYLKSIEFNNLLNSTMENIKNNPDRLWSNLKLLKEELKAYNKKSRNNLGSKCSSPALSVVKIENIDSASSKCSDAEIKDSDSKSNCFEADKSVSTAPTENNKISDISIALSAESTSISNLLESEPEKAKLEKCANLLKQGIRNRLASDSSSNTGMERNSTPAFLANLGLSSLNQAEAKAKIDRSVDKLEKFLAKLDTKIKELQAKELSLDDLDEEDSSYILEDKYKRKFNQTWTLLCKYKERSTNLGGEMEKKFHFKGTRYPEINTAIEKLINKKKVAEKFPNYCEVYSTIKATNETFLTGLEENDCSILAKEIFRDVIKELKRRRLKDSGKNFGCYLTDDFNPENDPAVKDENLRKTLDASYKEGSTKLDELFKSYVRKQEAGEGNEEDEKNSADEDDEQNSREEDEKENDFTDEEGKEKYSVAENDEHNSRTENKTNEASDELCDTDPNLPDTDPASPDSESELDHKKDTLKRKEKDDYIINVVSDSDASTDPGENVSKRIRTDSQPVSLSTEPEPSVQKKEDDSDEFYDLPSL